MTSPRGYSLVLTGMERERVAVDLPALVDNHSALLFRVAYSVLRSPVEAEDIVQDTFVRVMEHRHKLPEVRDLRVWLVRIAWRLALDRRRRIRPDQMDEPFAGSLAGRQTPADEAMVQHQRVRQVLYTLDRLPTAEAHALLLVGVEELSTAEVAAVLGKGEAAVRALLSRARKRLRERLAERSGS